MIVERSDQVPRLKWPRRFPVPRDFGVAKSSRIVEGNARVVPLASKREVADAILDAVEARIVG